MIKVYPKCQENDGKQQDIKMSEDSFKANKEMMITWPLYMNYFFYWKFLKCKLARLFSEKFI